MQKLVFIDHDDLSEVNELLEDDWELKSLYTERRDTSDRTTAYNLSRVCAYALLEKEN